MIIGQIIVRESANGGGELRHRDDLKCADGELTLHTDPEDAVGLALYDDAGAYRPLKTAPNLRHGWRMVLADGAAARLALDSFYPGRRGAFAAFQAGRLHPTPLRETLGRQTGMYRVTQKITEEQIDALVGSFCRSDGGCLRTILWKRDTAGAAPSSLLPSEKFDPTHDQSGQTREQFASFVPLLCQEACNLLVAKARAVVKGKSSSGKE